MKPLWKLLIVLCFVSCFIFITGFYFSGDKKSPFGVFVGLGPEKIQKLISYREVVIDAQFFSRKDITFLHENNVLVYSYLNIGSLEDFRPYYNDFLDITLGDYENWPGEKWLDVSSSQWNHYVVEVLAKDMIDKGVDGFFIDNSDIYSVFPEDKIFSGILAIIKGLHQSYDRKIILNSGFDFLDKAIAEDEDVFSWVQGVTKESVLTTIDFENKTFLKRSPNDSAWGLDQLKKIKSLGPEIYVIEYSNDPKLDRSLRFKYLLKGYKLYISNNIELN